MYPSGTSMYVIVTLIGLLSGYIGYKVGERAVSAVAAIEIGACYLAILAAAIIDLKTKTIPNYLTVSLFGIRLSIMIYELLFVEGASSYITASLVGAVFSFVALVIAKYLSKGGIGAGDIKLICGIGFVCGLSTVVFSLLLAMISCIVVSVLLLAMRKRGAKDDIPFGPFIYIGFTLMCLIILNG